MAHFAELDQDNIVIRVLVIPNEQEHRGEEYLKVDLNLGGISWKQTSYNTCCGVNSNGGISFRKNYAGKGFKYDVDRDAFIAPKIFPSWILNETTCCWEAPIPHPSDGKIYEWSENLKNWV